MKLIDLLIQRKNLAKDFTKKNFQERLKEELRYYEAMPPEMLDVLNVDLVEATNRRYNFIIPLIFTNHESMMASMFDRVPEIVFFQSGADDEGKEKSVRAAYEYLKKSLDLETFMNDAAWWFILSGFTSAHAGYKQKTEDKPVLDDNGQPVLDEVTGEVKTYTDFTEDDPTIEVDDPLKVAFSPESEFSYGADKVPYYVREKLMEVEEVKRTYDKDDKKDIQADATIDKNEGLSTKDAVKSDLDRVRVNFYYGRLPKEVAGEVKGWDYEKEYLVVFTTKTILHVEESPFGQKMCRLLKWHGAPNKFFGFGIGKLLQPFQREKSIRRGQQVRFADVAAFPKILLPNDTEVDKKALRDPREEIVILFDQERGKPEYLSAPNIGSAVSDANQQADQDAQQASGMMDLSTGSQQTSTVDTATGQTIFADAAERRMRLAKKKFLKFYRECVILLLELAKQNWQSDKLVHIMGEDGQMETMTVNAQSLSDIDFDTDVDIDAESVTLNKDVIRQQAIELYDRVKDDPLVDRKEVFKYMLENGFEIKNGERFMNEAQVPPGTELVDPLTNQMFIVGESGELIDQQTMSELRQPDGGEIASTPGGIAGSAQNVAG